MQLITKEELADLIFENKESMYRLARGRDKLSTIL